MKKIAQSKKRVTATRAKKTAKQSTREQMIEIACERGWSEATIEQLQKAQIEDHDHMTWFHVMADADGAEREKRSDAPSESRIEVDAATRKLRTLADLGITPARAWALHQVGLKMGDGTREEEFKRENALLAGYGRGLVRVLHQSFGLLVFYVPDDLPQELFGIGDDEITRDVVAVAFDQRGRPAWRNIGYVDSDDGKFVDVLDINGGSAPLTVDRSLEAEAPERERWLANAPQKGAA